MSVPPLPAPVASPPPEPAERPEGPDPVTGRPDWRPWTAFVALIGGFAAALIGALIVLVTAGVVGADFDDPGVNIAGTFVQDAALIGSAMVFARLAGPPRPWQFGLRGTRALPAAGWMALAWGTFVAFSAVWVALLHVTQRDELPRELGVEESTAAMLAVAVLVAVVAPLAEEVFFRGYFFTALRNWRGMWVAAVITGIVFGVIHAGSSPIGFLVPLAFLGFVLCLLYARTGSLYPCIVLHSFNNSVAFGASQGWDWQIAVLAFAALSAIVIVLAAIRRAFGPSPAPRPA
jgi:hypothetical protein